MLHIHNPNIPESKTFFEEKNSQQSLKTAIMSEAVHLKTKTKKTKTNKENISPLHKISINKTKQKTAFPIDIEKTNLGEITNKCMFFPSEKDQENYLKAFLKQLMPDKNPMLLIGKFIDEMKQNEIQNNLLSPIAFYKQMGINEEYDVLYGSSLEEKMYEDEPDYSELLKNTKITDQIRAKMVDWMLEIFSKYPEMSSNDTYFRAISIFHLHLKKCFEMTNKVLTDADIHLSGMAAMFLATKYEDESHIQLKDFVSLIGHNTFSMNEIKEREWEIYSNLNFNLTFPTCFSFLNFYYFKCFGNHNSIFSSNLYEIALYVLKLCHYVSSLIEIKPHLIASCSLLYSIKIMFNGLDEKQSCNYFEIEKKMIDIVMSVTTRIDLRESKTCIEKINQLVVNWDTFFPKMMNIQKPEFELRS